MFSSVRIFLQKHLTNLKHCDIIYKSIKSISFIEMWLSLVERCVRDAEVAGSNPVISTIETYDLVGKVKALTFVGAFFILYNDTNFTL